MSYLGSFRLTFNSMYHHHHQPIYISSPPSHMESQNSNDGGTHNHGNLTNHHGHDGTALTSSEPPWAPCQARSLSPAECTKVATIMTACESARPIDLLSELATSNAGLVDDEVRRLACESMTTSARYRMLIHRSRADFAWLRCEDYARSRFLSSMATSTPT